MVDNDNLYVCLDDFYWFLVEVLEVKDGYVHHRCIEYNQSRVMTNIHKDLKDKMSTKRFHRVYVKVTPLIRELYDLPIEG